MNITEVMSHFYQGKYEEVLKTIGKAPLPSTHAELEKLTSIQVGSLVFIGEFAEAQVIYQRLLKLRTVNPLYKTQCRFFLGIGCVRKSDFQTASQYFASNVRELKVLYKIIKNDLDVERQEIIFYTYQGSAFYRFIKGKFKQARVLSAKSYSAAFEAQFIYGMILSLDLLGFSLCRTGFIRRGIYELERALKLARELGNGGITATLTVALVIFRSRFGIEIVNSVSKLKQAIDKLDTQNTYSKGDLYLELTRQFILRGHVSEAQSQLNKLGDIVYVHQNKLQLAQLNLLYAQLLLLRGEVHGAMVMISNLRGQVDSKFDQFFIRRLELIEANVKVLLFNPNTVLPLEKRGFYYLTDEINKGEDVIGDIIESVETEDESFVYELKSNGLLGLIPQVLKLPMGFVGLYLGPSKSEMIILNKGDVHWVDKGVTNPIKKLIYLLIGEKFKTKEYLVKEVWGYEYSPIPHDSLLHATVGKVRGLLGNHSAWVEWFVEGYRLMPGVSVVNSKIKRNQEFELTSFESIADSTESNLASKQSVNVKKIENLNIRQIKLLKFLRSDDFIGVSEFSKKYKVCKMTACRDLTYLHQRGLVVRIGKGRATVYGLSVNGKNKF